MDEEKNLIHALRNILSYLIFGKPQYGISEFSQFAVLALVSFFDLGKIVPVNTIGFYSDLEIRDYKIDNPPIDHKLRLINYVSAIKFVGNHFLDCIWVLQKIYRQSFEAARTRTIFMSTKLTRLDFECLATSRTLNLNSIVIKMCFSRLISIIKAFPGTVFDIFHLRFGSYIFLAAIVAYSDGLFVFCSAFFRTIYSRFVRFSHKAIAAIFACFYRLRSLPMCGILSNAILSSAFSRAKYSPILVTARICGKCLSTIFTFHRDFIDAITVARHRAILFVFLARHYFKLLTAFRASLFDPNSDFCFIDRKGFTEIVFEYFRKSIRFFISVMAFSVAIFSIMSPGNAFAAIRAFSFRGFSSVLVTFRRAIQLSWGMRSIYFSTYYTCFIGTGTGVIALARTIFMLSCRGFFGNKLFPTLFAILSDKHNKILPTQDVRLDIVDWGRSVVGGRLFDAVHEASSIPLAIVP